MLASCKLILGEAILVLVRAIIIDFHAVIISKRGNTVIVMHSLVSFVCISLRACKFSFLVKVNPSKLPKLYPAKAMWKQ